jgi:hypothetical protein
MLVAACVMGQAIAGSAVAGERRVDAIPFRHQPCSVLNDMPCTPMVCSPLIPGPCLPEMNVPIGENLQLTVERRGRDEAPENAKPDHPLATLRDLFAALRACWTPPPISESYPGMEMSVRISFKRSGEIFALPRMTYSTPGVSQEIRDTYLLAIANSLAACTPLRLTDELGGAIAGRPLLIRDMDGRGARHAVLPHSA